ncbi:MAG: LLM class flavin-dependent oxidoreductase, partial [Actinomycetia bacterium]|nr:LLM class flavin-dependent oxidoreductase [Actinomycetes bacterium]
TEPVRPQVDGVAAILAHAERCGLDSAWVGESYHANPETFHLPASLVVLGHLAGRTALHLGTAVLLLRAYSPERLAYEVALLDQLCDGRLTLGVGLGSPEVAQRTGVPRTGPAGTAFDSALATLREAWSPGSTGNNGTVVPPPVQPGGPKILVGGKTAASVRRAATLADGYYGATNYTDDLLVSQATAFWSRRGGRPDEVTGEVATTRFCLVHEDPATARNLAGQYFKAATDYYTARNAWAGADGPGKIELPLVGSPDQVNESIRRYAEAGVTSLQLRVAPHGTPREVAQHTLTLVGNEVLPAWRSGGSS